jgi:hypothetical protein
MKKPTFKLGLRDQQRAVKTHMESLARLHGVTLPEGALSDVKDKVTRTPKPHAGKLEAKVQSEIIDYLLRHPAVALVERINSGAVYNANGAFIRFHHIYTPKQFKTLPIERSKFRAPDLHVTLTDGKRCVIECKAESWQKPCNEREYEQANYIAHIIAHGGIGFFAASVEAVRKNLILNGY